MRNWWHLSRRAGSILLLGALFISARLHAQSNVTIRVMAANLNGNTQSYQPFALRILQGLQPDIVCLQEFNYGANAAVDFRSMVDAAFGTNFAYYREPYTASGDIPNGVISRYPIISSGSWADTVQSQPNRGYAWAQIGLPGTNNLYVVSVHLLTSSATARGTEAANLTSLIQASFPSNAWIVVAGDFNTDSRTESPTMTTFGGYLSDNPIPVDNLGNSDTSQNRNHPHDYVLPSFSFTNLESATVLPSHAFPSGLVFDSQVYTPLSDVSPVIYGDSTNAQHMAVMKDFQIPYTATTNSPTTNAPSIITQPQSQTVPPGSNVTFTVSASGTVPLSYQWLFNSTNIAGANTNPFTLTNVQPTNAGNYSVIVTNMAGSVTSSNAVLIVSNLPPTITTQPQSQTVNVGDSPTFSVVASGATPLSYQWRLGTTNISGATTNSYTLSNVQTNDAGNFTVVITNISGSVTSSVATLTVNAISLTGSTNIIAQWNFNSVSPDANVATGTTSPSIGSGTAALVGGTTATFATGDTTRDPAGSTDNSGWNTTTYPAQGTGNKTRGAQFTVSTAGNQNLVVSWSSQSSNTGSKYGRLQYTTNGTDFVDFPIAFTNGTSFTAKMNSLAAISGVNNNPNFAIRLVSEFESTALGTANANFVAANATSTYGSAGTMRYDMVTLSGAAIPTNTSPALPALLGGFAFAGNQFQFLLTGSAGSNYIVQVSTSLDVSNWTSLLTNASPFTFTESNASTFPQRFYRAMVAP
jgi:endonuclease/exonuclease/phosphatase family metal-dependent hydrolase